MTYEPERRPGVDLTEAAIVILMLVGILAAIRVIFRALGRGLAGLYRFARNQIRGP